MKIIGTYLPTGKRNNEYQNELLTITDIVNNTQENVLVIGDMNGDIMRSLKAKPYKNDKILHEWLKQESRIHNMIWLSNLFVQYTNYTFKSAKHQSLIDYVLLVAKQQDNLVRQVNILAQLKENNSDHLPIQTLIEFSDPFEETASRPLTKKDDPTPGKNPKKQIKWEQIGERSEYEKVLNNRIKECNFLNKYAFDTLDPLALTASINELHDILIQARNDTITCLTSKYATRHRRPKKCKSQMPWWNKDIENVHRLKFKYNGLWLKTRNEHFRGVYNYYRSKARKMEKQAARQSIDEKARELTRKFRNKRQFWKALDNNASPEKEVDIDPSVLRSSYQEIFNNKLLTMSEEEETRIKQDNEAYYNRIINTVCTQSCQLRDIQAIIKKLKNKKAPGLSGINNEMIKYGGARLAILITHIINGCLKMRTIPPHINIGVMLPILKDEKKSNKDLDNTRPLTLSESITSIIENFLLLKLENAFTEEPSQFGFRRNSSTSHAVFTLKETLLYNRSKNKPTIACFIDFSKAFDKVNRHKLFEKLRPLLDPDSWALLYAYYTTTSIKIKGEAKEEPSVHTTIGVKQGGPLSPKLFAVYVNDLIKSVLNASITCKLGDIETGILLYADDTVICTNSFKRQNEALAILNDYCIKHEIMINIQKTKYMTFNGNQLGKEKNEVKIGTSIVEQVSKFKYLGCWIESNLQSREHTKSRKQAILAAAAKLRKLGFNSKEMSLDVKTFLFNTYCRTAAQYGLACGYNTQNDIRELTILDNKILKVAFGLTKYHSTSMLLNAVKVKPLDKLIRIRKLQMIAQLLKYDLTARIIEHQLLDQNQIPSKSYIREIIDSHTDPQVMNIDTLITIANDKIVQIEQNIRNEQNNERAIAVNYLIRHDSPKNHQIVRKMLSWENRTKPVTRYGRVADPVRRLG